MGRKPQATQLMLMIRPTTIKIAVNFIVYLLDDGDVLFVVERLEVDPQLAEVNVKLFLQVSGDVIVD